MWNLRYFHQEVQKTGKIGKFTDVFHLPWMGIAFVCRIVLFWGRIAGRNAGQRRIEKMVDVECLLRKTDEMGIINIDASSGMLSSAVLQCAIDATKRLNASIDKAKIAAKLREADILVATRCG